MNFKGWSGPSAPGSSALQSMSIIPRSPDQVATLGKKKKQPT